MNTYLLTGIALLTASATMAQNSVIISQTNGSQMVSVNQQGGGQSAIVMQSGGASGNRASITQSGSGERGLVQVSQHGNDTTGAAANQVRLHVEKGTQTTVTQQSAGANTVEISREGLPTATISQSSAVDKNSITVLPDQPTGNRGERPIKRRNWRR